MLKHYEAYRHNTHYDHDVQCYGEACGYNYKLNNLLRHGSIAFKHGVIVQYDRALCGYIVCHVTAPDGSTFNSSVNLIEDLAALLPNGIDDVQGDWAAIAIRRYGEQGTIEDLLQENGKLAITS